MKLITNMRPGIDRLILWFPFVDFYSDIDTVTQFMEKLNCIRIKSVVDVVLIYEADHRYFTSMLEFSKVSSQQSILCSVVLDNINIYVRRINGIP